jgi:hypothetical protein
MAIRVLLALAAVVTCVVATDSQAWKAFSNVQNTVELSARRTTPIAVNSNGAGPAPINGISVPGTAASSSGNTNYFRAGYTNHETLGNTGTPANATCYIGGTGAGQYVLTISTAVAEACGAGSKGTHFDPFGIVGKRNTTCSSDKTNTGAGDVTIPAVGTSPWCTYCMLKGYGTNANTPGFYVPCGAQNVCVDVSGNSYLNATGKGAVQLSSCQDYIKYKLVSSTTDLITYHTMLWVSLGAAIVLAVMIYYMVFMPLDMDSLLFEVGEGSKKVD